MPVTTLRDNLDDRHTAHERQILDRLDGSKRVTQRSIASELGIALGLTNLLMRGLVKKGWVRIRRVSPRRMIYFITPAGLRAKSEMTRQYFLNSLNFYRETRGRVRERLAAIAGALVESGTPPPVPVVFYGAGEVAEVAFVCLREAGLELVGVVDDGVPTPFFDARTHGPDALRAGTLAGRAFVGVIVMPLQDEAIVRAQLTASGVPPAAVYWL